MTRSAKVFISDASVSDTLQWLFWVYPGLCRHPFLQHSICCSFSHQTPYGRASDYNFRKSALKRAQIVGQLHLLARDSDRLFEHNQFHVNKASPPVSHT